LKCGACGRVFDLELATGGFCEACLSVRLAKCREREEVHRAS
jgi:DNA-directed RNA polymerase subunit RPC12/RpoP